MEDNKKTKTIPKGAGSKLRERSKKRREQPASTDALFEILETPSKEDHKKSAIPRGDKDLDL